MKSVKTFPPVFASDIRRKGIAICSQLRDGKHHLKVWWIVGNEVRSKILSKVAMAEKKVRDLPLSENSLRISWMPGTGSLISQFWMIVPHFISAILLRQ